MYAVRALRRSLPSLCFAGSALAAALPGAAEPPAQAPGGSPASSESASPSAAPAPTLDQGVSFGLRTGWSIPIGSLEKNDPMRSNFTAMVPFWLDAGYRLSKHFYLGAYFQVGPMFVSDDVCPGNLSCSAYDLRFGINAHWHFKWIIAGGEWAGPFDPWLGIGSGYEGATIWLSTPVGARSSETRYGFELGNIQLGGDYRGSAWRLGAFTSLSAAQYARISRDQPTGSSTYVIEHPTAHSWLSFGLRFQYDL